MKNIIVIGAGGHGAEIDEYIIYSQNATGIKELKVVGFLDDNPAKQQQQIYGVPVLGTISDLSKEKGMAPAVPEARDRRHRPGRGEPCHVYTEPSAFLDP